MSGDFDENDVILSARQQQDSDLFLASDDRLRPNALQMQENRA
jgi:hypothetical protein